MRIYGQTYSDAGDNLPEHATNSFQYPDTTLHEGQAKRAQMAEFTQYQLAEDTIEKNDFSSTHSYLLTTGLFTRFISTTGYSETEGK